MANDRSLGVLRGGEPWAQQNQRRQQGGKGQLHGTNLDCVNHHCTFLSSRVVLRNLRSGSLGLRLTGDNLHPARVGFQVS